MIRTFTSQVKSRSIILIFLCFLSSMLAFPRVVSGQSGNLVHAKSVISYSRVDDRAYAVDELPNTYAKLKAVSLLLPGKLELGFNQTVPANTTVYVQLKADDGLLDALVGGTLGKLLKAVANLVVGHEFKVEGYKSGTSSAVFSHSSANNFASARAKMIVGADGNRYLAITTSGPIDRVYIENWNTGVLGLLGYRSIEVARVFYPVEGISCGTAFGTSYDMSGLTLSVLNSSQVIAKDLANAIDNNMNTASKLSPGVINVTAFGSAHQYFYFGGASKSTDEFKITMKLDQQLLNVNLLSNMQLFFYNGANSVGQSRSILELGTTLGGLLDLDLLGLFNSGEKVTFSVQPGAAFDRVELRVGSALNLSATNNISVFEVSRTAGKPKVVGVDANDTRLICTGENVTLQSNANTSSDVIKWYTSPVGGTPVHTGASFNVGPVAVKTIYYVSATSAGCSEESLRTKVIIDINKNPLLVMNGSSSVSGQVGQTVSMPTVTATNESGSPVTNAGWTSLNNAPRTGTTAGPFTAPGTYVYRYSATGDGCTNYIDFVVYVRDPSGCDLVFNRVFANNGTEFTEPSLAGLKVGHVTNASSAANGNLTSYSTLTETVNALNLLGYTSQTLRWNQNIPSGTAVTVRLAREFSTAVVAGGVTVQAFNDGVPIGEEVVVDNNLVGALGGFMDFDYTFVPRNSSNVEVAYNGVRIKIKSLLNVAQTVRVYGAYYNQRTTTLQNCNTIQEVRTGYETTIPTVELASGLNPVLNPGNAIDGNPNSAATIFRLANVAVKSKLDIKYNAPILVGDSLRMKIGVNTGLLDLGVLAGYSIQRYYEDMPVGSPISLNSSLLKLNLLSGNSTGYLTMKNDANFDRIKILAGGVASVAESLLIYEVDAIPMVSLPNEKVDGSGKAYLEFCAGSVLVLPTVNCTDVKFYDALTGGNEVTLADLQALPAGTVKTVYIQAVRFGCSIGTFRRAIEIRVIDVPKPVISPAGNQQVSGGGSITLSVSNAASYPAGTTYEWFKGGVKINGKTASTLQLSNINLATDLGQYTVIAVASCSSPVSDPVTLTARISTTHSSLVVTKDNAVANGVDENRLLATIKDNAGNPLPNRLVVFEIVDVNNVASTQSVTTNASGQSTIALTSVKTGIATVEAHVGGQYISGSPKSVTFVAGPVDHAKSTLIVVEDNAIADGVDENVLLATLVDANNNPVPNTAVSFGIKDVDNNTTTQLVNSDVDGLAYLFVRSNKAGVVEVSALVGAAAISGSPKSVTFVDGDRLSVYKLSDQTRVVAGEVTTYTITIRNNGLLPQAAGKVITMLERPDAKLSIEKFELISGAATLSNTGNDVKITLTSALAVGAEIKIKVFAKVDPSAIGTVVNGVSIWEPDTPTTDVPDDTDDTVPIPVDQVTDLSIEKTVNNSKPFYGSNIEFTITATNEGPSDALETWVIDQLPDGFEYVSSTATRGQYNVSNHRWTIGALAVNQQETLKIVAKVLDEGDYINYATVYGKENDPDLSNNTDTPDEIVEPRINKGLRIEKQAEVSTVPAGGNIDFTVSIFNDGPDAVDANKEIVVKEFPSTGLTITNVVVSSGSATLVYAANKAVLTTTAAIQAGQKIVLKVTGKVAENAPSTISNGVKVWGPDKDPEKDPVDDETETPEIPVNNNATLSIAKKVDQAVVVTGKPVSFTVTITNNGPGILKSGEVIHVEERPSVGVDITDMSVTSGNATVANTKDNFYAVTPSSDVAKGAVITLKIEGLVVATAGAKISNGIAVWGPDKDPEKDPEDDEDETPEIPVSDNYVLAVDKKADQASVSPGSEVTFTITVSNKGPEEVPAGHKVTLKELPGQGLTIQSYEVTSGAATIQGNGNQALITVTSAGIPSGGSVVIKIKGLVDENAKGSISNGVAIWNQNKDPETDTPDDEDSSDPVRVDDQLVIPNLFTPNGDGLNDRFVIRGLEQYDQRELIIINRWGNQIYSSKNYNNDWDGASLSDGTYYYILTVRKSGTSATYKGTVAIVRQTNR